MEVGATKRGKRGRCGFRRNPCAPIAPADPPSGAPTRRAAHSSACAGRAGWRGRLTLCGRGARGRRLFCSASSERRSPHTQKAVLHFDSEARAALATQQARVRTHARQLHMLTPWTHRGVLAPRRTVAAPAWRGNDAPYGGRGRVPPRPDQVRVKCRLFQCCCACRNETTHPSSTYPPSPLSPTCKPPPPPGKPRQQKKLIVEHPQPQPLWPSWRPGGGRAGLPALRCLGRVRWGRRTAAFAAMTPRPGHGPRPTPSWGTWMRARGRCGRGVRAGAHGSHRLPLPTRSPQKMQSWSVYVPLSRPA